MRCTEEILNCSRAQLQILRLLRQNGEISAPMLAQSKKGITFAVRFLKAVW